MPYPLNDDFADKLGRWQQYAPWDAPMYYDSSKGFLTTQSHANIRNFRAFTQSGPRPQTSLEASPQSTWDATTQTNMETWVISTEAEPWTINSSTPRTLTVSGNEITDATRATEASQTTTSSGVMCEGITNDGSFGIFRAATNLFRRGQCDATTDYTPPTAGTTLSTDATTPPPFSTQSIKVVNNGSVANQGVVALTATGQAAAATTAGVASFYIKGVAGQSYIAFTQWYNTDASVTPGSSVTFTATGSWQRITPPFVAVATAKTGDQIGVFIETNGTRAETFWVAHPMIEKGKTLGAPYVTTSGGATATHAEARVQGPGAALSSTRGWFAMRRRMFHPSTNTGEEDMVWWQDGGGDIAMYNNGQNWYMDNSDNTASQILAYSAGDKVTCTGYWSPTTLGLSLNGGNFVTATTSAPPTITAAQFDIGRNLSAGFDNLNGDVMWFACGTGTLTNADAATLNALGDTAPTMSTLSSTAGTTLIWDAVTSSYASADVGLSGLTVGAISSRGGWSGLKATTTGSTVVTTLTSSIPNDNLDLSALNSFLVIFPDYNAFDTTSTITLTSNPDGTFGTAAYNSAAVPFSSNTAVMPQLRFALSLFSSGAGASFTLSKVTGVQISLGKAVAPAANQVVTIMGMRAVNNTWTESALDFDTRLGALCPPVTLTGAAYAGTVAKDFPLVRGDGSRNDPVPADGAYNIYFYPGGSTSPNDATGATYNVLSVIARETKNIGAGTGAYVAGRLKWNDSGAAFEIVTVSMTGGAGGTITTTVKYTESLGSLDPAQHYMFRVELTGTTMAAHLYTSYLDGTLTGNTVWSSKPYTDSSLAFGNGRVGFRASLVSRDSYVTSFQPSVTNYATLQTKTFSSVTPVNGARLAAVYSADENLFTDFTGIFTLDSTKTLSGNASYSTTGTLISNQFTIDDWAQSYLELDLWVGSSVTTANQPTIALNTSGGPLTVPVPKLQANRWNHILVDLTLFQNQLTGVGYTLTIAPGTKPDRALGLYWVDGMTVGRRRVSWAIRAQSNGLWREFRDMVNEPKGALHLNPDERGTALQLRANALTPDAWTASFKLRPHYAELGNPVYDPN